MAGAADPLMFARLVEESAGTLEPGLRAWTITVTLGQLPFEARIEWRNRALLAAASFLGAGLTRAEQARRLRAELASIRRRARPAHVSLADLEGALTLALLARDAIPRMRQLVSILSVQPA